MTESFQSAAICAGVCWRSVSLLPEFALPYLRSSITVIALFLMARFLHGKTSPGSAPARLALSARPILGPPVSPPN